MTATPAQYAQSSMLVPSGKMEVKDQRINMDLSGGTFANHNFIRLVAKHHRFVGVDFRFCTFDACYLRGCEFDSCDFTGSRFVGTNLHGSSFAGCNFEYASFERTDIDNDILSTSCPGPENLKKRFARSLRMNFQQLGDADSVNKAIGVELDATENYLYKSWQSNEAYYRKKYRDWKRVGQWVKWVNFKALDFLWGNGERAWKLARAVALIFLPMAIYDTLSTGQPELVSSYIHSFLKAPQVFLGVVAPNAYPTWYIALVTLLRLIFFALFMAIVVKRFNRR